jgi:uncharacterized protein (TIGR02246 family)
VAATSPEESQSLFQRFVEERDLDALVDLYAADAVLVGDDGEHRVGHTAIREYLQAMFDADMHPKLEPLGLVRSGDLALEKSRWTMTLPDGSGGVAHFDGISVVVLRRSSDDRWRIVLDDPGVD